MALQVRYSDNNHETGVVEQSITLFEALTGLLCGFLTHTGSQITTGPENVNLWVRYPDGRPNLQLSRTYTDTHGDMQPLVRIARVLEILQNWGQPKYDEYETPQLDYLRRCLKNQSFKLPPRETLSTNLGIVLTVLPAVWPDDNWPTQTELGNDSAAALALIIEEWLKNQVPPRQTLQLLS